MIFVVASSSSSAKSEQGPPIVLPPVIVTGTNSPRQAEDLMLPEAVTSVSSERMEQAGMSSMLALPQVVPNFSQSHTGLRSFSDIYSVRGLGNTEFLSDPAVVLYVDDAPFGEVTTYETDLLAADRVDVYRGPQGTRFGQNSEAGVINITTRKPGPTFESEARASVASFYSQQYQALAMGSIAKDTLYFSLTGQYARSDGFIRNTFLNSHADKQEGLNGRATLLWAPSENWQIDFTLTGHRFDDGIGLVPLSGPARATRSDFDGKFNERVNGESLRVKGAVSGLAVTSITTRRDFHLNPFQFDVDFSPATGNTGTVRRLQLDWSEEVRLGPSEPGDKWKWQAGFFFSTAGTHLNERGDFFVPPLALSAVDLTDFTARSDNYAIFGDCTRTIGNKLAVTLGLRLDETTRELDRTHVATLGSAPPLHASVCFFNAAPKLTLAYHVREALFVYASTGLGFKAGGFSPYIDPPISPRFSTETAWASEVGAKSSWLDDRVRANLSIFYNDVTDYQVEQFVPNSFNFTVVNAPRAHTMGAELELTVRPFPGWELTGFSGLTDARLERFTNPYTAETVRDTHPPFVANFNTGVAAEYRLPAGLLARLEYAVVGDTFYDAANSARLKQSAYGLLAARIGFERKHWGVFLFGQNLTDTGYFTKKIPPLNAGAPGQPQTFGVMAVARY